MKKICIFTVFLVLVSMLTACSVHQHEALSAWDRDVDSHWHPCDCGEKVELAPHELDGESCTVCGSQISDFGDSVYVYNYNDHGDEIRCSAYENGKLISDTSTEYEYDEAGNYVSVKYYDNDALYQEDLYRVNSSGENTVYQSTWYTDLYFTMVSEYDENGNEISLLQYDNGTLITENYHTYNLDENGEFYLYETVTKTDDGNKTVTTYNSRGDEISLVSFYDGTQGEAYLYDYQYDEEDRIIYKSITKDGMLFGEEFYGVVDLDDGWYTYVSKYVSHNPDGTMIVEEFNENDEMINQYRCDKEGNVIE